MELSKFYCDSFFFVADSYQEKFTNDVSIQIHKSGLDKYFKLDEKEENVKHDKKEENFLTSYREMFSNFSSKINSAITSCIKNRKINGESIKDRKSDDGESSYGEGYRIVPNKMFATDFHDCANLELLGMLGKLAAGGYNEENGSYSKILPGARGMGKSTCLKSIVAVAPILFPNVFGFYASYRSFRNVSKQNNGICEVILCALRNTTSKEEPDAKPHTVNCSAELDNYLLDTGKRLVLVLDEMDEMFTDKCHDDAKLSKFIESSLNELGALAQLVSGRLVILLSGSSRRIETYVTGKMDLLTESEKQCPILNLEIDMNGDRFGAIEISPTDPTDFETAKKILQDVPDEEVNFRLFCYGPITRSLLNKQKGNGFDKLSKPLQHRLQQFVSIWYHVNRDLTEKIYPTFECGGVNLQEKNMKGKQRDKENEKNIRDVLKADSWKEFKGFNITDYYVGFNPSVMFDIAQLEREGMIIVIKDCMNHFVYPRSVFLFFQQLPFVIKSLAQALEATCLFVNVDKQKTLDLCVDGIEAVKKAATSPLLKK